MPDLILTDTIPPAFYGVHHDIKEHGHTHYTFVGGRGSGKSTNASAEALLVLKRNPGLHAVAFRKVAATLKDSVYAQYLWAITKMGMENEWRCLISPMQITHKVTGQKVIFRGLDKWDKVKSIKVPFGYIGVTHFEELDQFAGRGEIRQVLQSTMRGGDLFWNFEVFNPPITQANWANKDILIPRNDRLVHRSCYLDMPPGWLGEQFLDEAMLLKSVDERAYRHEYLGEPVGTGGAVFENLTIREISDGEILNFERTYYGADFGWFPDPWAFIGCSYVASQRKLFIHTEAVAWKKNSRESADLMLACGLTPRGKSAPREEMNPLDALLRIEETVEPDMVVCDSEDPKTIADYQSFGIRAVPAEKPAGSVVYSHKWLQGLAEIVIDPVRCPHAAEEFMEYEYERSRTGDIITGYPDRDNHCIDATRYATNYVWRKRGV